MNELLLLIPEDCEKNKPTKILDANLQKVKSFDAGSLFYFEPLAYENFHDALKLIFSNSNCFLVLGELNDFGQSLQESGKAGLRRKVQEHNTIQDRDGTEIVLDLDDHILPGFDVENPEPAIKTWLENYNINCDVTWQITSGQKLNTEEARLRLYFTCTKPVSLQLRKAWSQNIGCDGSVYTCSQPIYTAPPQFPAGIVDPIPNRHGFLKGERDKIRLPEMPEEEVIKYSGFARGGENWDFSDTSLPDEVLSGKVYRRYFMPLAFHYANLLNGDRDAIFAIIAAKATLVKTREFNLENTYAYIDDAIAKINQEQTQLKESVVSAEELEQAEESQEVPVPEFPAESISDWPDPWPMLWENFKRIPRQLEPALLFPTVLALNSYFLRSRFITAYGRRPNMFFLNLTPSTGNKDVNSKNVIRDLDLLFKQQSSGNLKVNMFSNIVNAESSITSDTSFLQSFSEDGELFWVNTEATRIFQQIKNSGANSNVMALSDKLIEVVDGHEITGKIKATSKAKTIEDPNTQILFYAQPETIEQYIDESMVDSGLFGRALLSIVPTLDFNDDEYELLMDRPSLDVEIDDEFVEFYKSKEFNREFFRDKKEVLKPTKKQMELINLWAREHIVPIMKKDETMFKVLSRIGNSAEQIYSVILGICQIYDQVYGNTKREKIDITCILPILEYWVDTKIYAIDNYISTAADPIAEAVIDVIKKCLNGDYKMPRTNDAKCIKNYNMVPKAQIMRILKRNKNLIRMLKTNNNANNFVVRAEQVVNSLVRTGVLIEKLLKMDSGRNRSKLCLGLAN